MAWGKKGGKGHRKGKEQHYSSKKTYFDSQRLSTLPAGALNLELHLQHVYLFQELIGGCKMKGGEMLVMVISRDERFELNHTKST